jgi:dTMP kinase
MSEKNHQGKYIVIEGPDGTGKTTQASMLTEAINFSGQPAIEVFEPGLTAIGSELRTIIKNGELARDPITNLLLFTADRRESWNQIIEPTLAAGTWVVSARNWYSTIAYQGYAEGLSLDLIEEMTTNYVSNSYANPDMAIILKPASQSELNRRINSRGAEQSTVDIFESQPDTYKQKIIAGYLGAVAAMASNVIDTSGKDIPTVHRQIMQLVETLGL